MCAAGSASSRGADLAHLGPVTDPAHLGPAMDPAHLGPVTDPISQHKPSPNPITAKFLSQVIQILETSLKKRSKFSTSNSTCILCCDNLTLWENLFQDLNSLNGPVTTKLGRIRRNSWIRPDPQYWRELMTTR
jgi:hypothetical protein